MIITKSIRRLKARCAEITPLKALEITLTTLPLIACFAGEAMAVVNLDEGAKEFISPVVKFINDWSPTFVFAAGTIGAIAAPGDLRIRFGGALGGMTVAGLGIFAAKKMLGVADVG